MTFIVKDVVMNEITSAMMMRPQLIQTIPNNLECIPRGTRSPYLTKRKRQLYLSHAKFYRKPFMADDVTTPTQNVSFQDHNWKMVDERNLQRDASLFKTIFKLNSSAGDVIITLCALFQYFMNINIQTLLALVD